MTAWGALVILLVTWACGFLPVSRMRLTDLSQSLIWGGMIRHDLITLVFRVIFLGALMQPALSRWT
jgi:hypothetical protein